MEKLFLTLVLFWFSVCSFAAWLYCTQIRGKMQIKAGGKRREVSTKFALELFLNIAYNIERMPKIQENIEFRPGRFFVESSRRNQNVEENI